MTYPSSFVNGPVNAFPPPSSSMMPGPPHAHVHASGGWPGPAAGGNPFGSQPFAGAPPPMPSGLATVAQAAWQRGQWIANPHYRPMVTASAQAGAAAFQGHPAAMAAAQQQWAAYQWPGMANYNPYKRIPKPADPEYWATKLSDNGLKLENMHIREDPKKKQEQEIHDHLKDAPTTPWLWAPRELTEADEPHPHSHHSQHHPHPRASDHRSTSKRPSPENKAPHPDWAYDDPRGQLIEDHRKRAQAMPNGRSRPSATGEDSRRSSGSSNFSSEPRSGSHDSGYWSASGSGSGSGSGSRHSFSSSQQRSPTDGPGQARHSSHDIYGNGNGRTTMPADRTRRSSASDAVPRQYSYDSAPEDSRHRDRDRERERNHRRRPSGMQYTSASGLLYREPEQVPVSEPEPEPFTSHRELSLTFSPKVVRTPEHYAGTPAPDARRRGSDPHASRQGVEVVPPFGLGARRESRDRSSSRLSPTAPVHPTSSSGLDLSIPRSSRSRPGSAATTPTRPSPTSRPGSSASGSFTALSQLSDEPESISIGAVLSPLMQSSEVTPRPPSNSLPAPIPSPTHGHGQSSVHARPLGRYHTYPSVQGAPPAGAAFETIPEQEAARAPLRAARTQIYASSSAQANGASHLSGPRPTLPAPPRDSPLNPFTSQSHSHPHAQPHAHTRTQVPPTTTISASAQASQLAHTRSTRGRRRGFWNRRGDHLTNTMHIVYAPPDRANPAELKAYPNPLEGFMDECDMIVPYDGNRPELPDSLPSKGKAPSRPYESFIQYCDGTN